MAKINLEDFDTSEILIAIDQFDRLRGLLANGDAFGAPSLSDDLLKLHEMAMQASSDASELIDQAFNVDDQIHELSEEVDKIQNIIMTVTDSIYEVDD